jgi:hypothetical protein
MADHKGEESVKKWHATIGKSAWALEEFQKYTGNATFVNGSKANASEYLLRIYMVKKIPVSGML